MEYFREILRQKEYDTQQKLGSLQRKRKPHSGKNEDNSQEYPHCKSSGLTLV
jgi:hypothetical protein